jgi:hypothetical protein
VARAVAIWASLATLLVADERGAHATLVRGFTLGELVAASDAIVVGEVAWQESVWDPAWKEVYTLSWIRVAERWRGSEGPGETVVLKQIGGVLDGLERRVVGTARLAIGDEVALFARTDGAFHYAIGMAQGVFHVGRAVGRAPLVGRRALPGMVGPTPGSPVAALPPEQTQLAALRAEVLRLLAERGAGVRR